MRTPAAWLSALLLLTACGPLGPQAANPVGRAGNGAKGATTPMTPGATQPTLPGAGTPVLDTAPLISNNAGNLIGKVKAPAGLIATNSGGLISDKGAGYRVSAVSQLPVAGATVRLMDAAGQAVMGPEGQPLVTTTDAQGNYGFTAALPPQHLLVEVTLPGDKGTLQAIAPRDGGAKRQVEVELVSTLTTTYILDQYVKTQKDPVLTLEKLPADVEAATRQKAASALDAGSVTTPDALTPAKVVETVNQLRAKDSSFDAQMETVKKLLIAAGLSDLGNGQKATEVYMARLFQVAAAPDGKLFAFSPDDRRIWRIGTDGVLNTAVGSGMAPDNAARDGKQAAAIALDHVTDLHVDGTGRLWFLEFKQGLSRLEADGTLTRIAPQATLDAALGANSVPRCFSLQPDGKALLSYGNALWSVEAGQALQKLATVNEVSNAERLGRDTQGRLYMLRSDKLYRYDPATQATTLIKDGAGADVQGSVFGDINTIGLDHRGNFFYVAKADQKLHVLRPDGTDTAVIARSALRDGLFVSAEGEDGKLYLVDCNPGVTTNPARLMRVRDGQLDIVAGRDGYATSFDARGAFSLQSPFGLAVEPDGALWIVDNGAVIRLVPGSAATVAHAAGTVLGGQPAQFTGVRRLPSGELILRAASETREFLVERDTQGTLTVRYVTNKTYANLLASSVYSFDAAPDKTLYLSKIVYDQQAMAQKASLLKLAPGSVVPETLIDASQGFSDIPKLKLGADGTVHLLTVKGFSKAEYWRWKADGGATQVPEGALFPDAVDAQGRAYEGDAVTMQGGNFGQRRIRRQDGGSVKIVAGEGGGLFNGSNLDETILSAQDLGFDAAGNLYFRDQGRRQVRRIPADKL